MNSENADLNGADLSYLRNSAEMLMGWNRSGELGEADFIANRGHGPEDGGGGFAFYDLANDGTDNQLMFLRSDGKLGIGATNPAEQLDVAGAIKLGYTANPTPVAGTMRWTGRISKGSTAFNGCRSAAVRR